MIAIGDAAAARFHADEPHTLIGHKASKMPIELLPPPTQATTRSGSRPAASSSCTRASWPITDWNSRTINGYGCGPSTDPSR
jgi:hypothetical protein